MGEMAWASKCLATAMQFPRAKIVLAVTCVIQLQLAIGRLEDWVHTYVHTR